MRSAQCSCLAVFAVAFSSLLTQTAFAEADITRNAVYQTDPATDLQTRESILQCVPYARQISGIRIFGDAHSWWDQADGVYARGVTPRTGAVLAFRATSAMPGGHVATVSRVIDNREVLLNHANWSTPGQIERDVRAVDISPDNDWSDVRVWYGPTAQLGTRGNPAYGFIYPERVKPDPRVWLASNSGPRSSTPRANTPPVRVEPVKTASAAPVRDDIFIIEYLDEAGRIMPSANTR